MNSSNQLRSIKKVQLDPQLSHKGVYLVELDTDLHCVGLKGCFDALSGLQTLLIRSRGDYRKAELIPYWRTIYNGSIVVL